MRKAFMHGTAGRRQYGIAHRMGYLAMLGGAILLAIIAGATNGAHAQAIDEYLDANVLSPGIAPGVTVLSRAHPDYDPTGVRVGLFTVFPVLDEGIGYDDNVTGTANAHGSIRVDSDAKITALGNLGDSKLNANVSVADTEFLSASSQSFIDWSAALSGTHDFGQDQLYLGAAHYNLNETPRELGVPDLDGAIAYRFDDVRASYTIGLSRLQIQPGLDVLWYGFDNGTVAGVPYPQSYRDRIVYQPSITGTYELAPRRSLVLVVRDANSSYSNSTPGIATQDFNDVSILGGIAYDVDGVVDIRLLAGYEERSFSASVYKVIQAPILEAALTWTPTELTTVTGTAARYITDSAAEGTVGKTETSLRVNLDHELFRNVIVNARVRLINDEYAQGGGSQQYYSAGAGATWRLNRLISLIGSYTFASRQSDDGSDGPTILPYTQVVGSNYTENVIRLRLRFAF